MAANFDRLQVMIADRYAQDRSWALSPPNFNRGEPHRQAAI
jgi:hypothetical protein